MGGAPGPFTELERSLLALRPRLHRYCARMTGSVIDGEDVLQDALQRAVAALPVAGEVGNLESWLFRIAHNAAIDFLRRKTREAARNDTETDPDMLADPTDTEAAHTAAAAGLRTFMRLPRSQRSTVILRDVLGYSSDEVSTILQTTVPSVKAALHRGRERLRLYADETGDRPLPVLEPAERVLLDRYVALFNARDFDAIRVMLAREVELDLVGRAASVGRDEVGKYFGNYDCIDGWRLAAGTLEGQPAILVFDAETGSSQPDYFVLVTWQEGELRHIRDFRYARYVTESAEFGSVPP